MRSTSDEAILRGQHYSVDFSAHNSQPKRTTHRTDRQTTQDQHQPQANPNLNAQQPATHQPQHPKSPHGTPPRASSLPELVPPLLITLLLPDMTRPASPVEWKASLSASRAMRASRRSCQSSASARAVSQSTAGSHRPPPGHCMQPACAYIGSYGVVNGRVKMLSDNGGRPSVVWWCV